MCAYIVVTCTYNSIVVTRPRTYLPVLPDDPPIAFGLVVGTKLVIYVTALYYGIPAGVIVHYGWLHVLLVVTLVVFYRTMVSDPGHIPKTTDPQQARKVRRRKERGWCT